MARYTEADRQAVLKARMDLATGKRIASVAIAGRTIAYAQGATMGQLAVLLGEIEADLYAQKHGRRSRTRHAITSKGL